MDAPFSSRQTRWCLAALACLALGSLGLLWPRATRAYVFEGPRWPNGTTVVLHLGLGSPSKPLLDGSTSWDSVAMTALNTWNPYLGSGVQLSGVVGSLAKVSGDGQNDVFFNKTVYGQSFGDDGLAVTQIYRSDGDITETDVVVNSDVSFDSYRGSLQGKKYDLQRVLIHEFGHVLGLDHVEDGTVSIMTPYISDLDTIQADDIAGVQALYNPAPPPTPTPTPTPTPIPSVPVLTSGLTVEGRVGEALSYYIVATDAPWTVTASNLPPGLSVYPTTAPFIEGLPTVAGSYAASITLTNIYNGGSSTTEVTFNIVTAPLNFFYNEQSLGNGVYYLALLRNAFGYYSYLEDRRYIYHFDLGYEYLIESGDTNFGVYLYDFTSDTFFYTSEFLPFPYLYDFRLNTMVYYYPDASNPGHYTSNPRYFYNFGTGQIITK